MFRVGEFEPPERLLGKYILETSTCTSIKKVMKKELTNKIVTHYNEKREDFEQYLKVKIQTYVDKNIPTELKKGYDDALVKANGESKEEEKEGEKTGEKTGEGESLSVDKINPLFLPDGKKKVSTVPNVHNPPYNPTADPTTTHNPIVHHDTGSKRQFETSHVLSNEFNSNPGSDSDSDSDSDYKKYTGEKSSTSNGPSSSDKSNKNQNTTNVVPEIVGVENGDKIAETKNDYSTGEKKQMGSVPLSTRTNSNPKINNSTNSNPNPNPNPNPNDIPGNPEIIDYAAIKGHVDENEVNVLAKPSEGVGLDININKRKHHPPPIPEFVPEKLYKDHNGVIVKYIQKIRDTDGKLAYKFFKPNPKGRYIEYSLVHASKFKEYEPKITSEDNTNSNESFHKKLNSDVNNKHQLKL